MYVNKLILTPFSQFDIKCKKLNVKNFWKCIFRASSREFSYFPKIILNPVGGALQYLLEFLWIMLQYSIQALCNI